MKYILVIGDGMADNPVAELGDRTPLEVAEKPHIDAMARAGTLGSVQNVPEGFPPGSDTAIMSIFGCAPQKYYAGRAPLEAAAQGIALQSGDAAFRCNNIALSDEADFDARRILSHCAGGLEDGQGRMLVEWLFRQPEFAALVQEAKMSLSPTESYRHIFVQRNADIRGLHLYPPHDNLGKTVRETAPEGCAEAETLYRLLKKANELLEAHPFNQARRSEGKLPANAIWFWAEGTAAKMPNFAEAYGHDGAVITAVPLCHGIAALCGLEMVSVPGATGEVITNYEGKVEATLRALEKYDFAAVHLEGPDECSHAGDVPGKVQAIEWLDSRIVAPIAQTLRERGEDFRMLILSDHKTFLAGGAHGGDSVPFLLYDSRRDSGSGLGYTEENGAKGPFLPDGTMLMPLLFEA